MSYQVLIPQEVEDAIAAQVDYLKGQAGASGERVDRWLVRLFDLIDSLQRWPSRFPVAATVSEAVGYEVRRANHGDYAVFFRVLHEKRLVELVAFRHGRRRPWLEKDVS